MDILESLSSFRSPGWSQEASSPNQNQGYGNQNQGYGNQNRGYGNHGNSQTYGNEGMKPNLLVNQIIAHIQILKKN